MRAEHSVDVLHPTVVEETPAGRIVVADSLTFFEQGDWRTDVVLGASFAGVPTGILPLRQGARGWLAHEAGPGLDRAGVAGLSVAEAMGVPAAAIATMTARLGDGRSLLSGQVAAANEVARNFGVVTGESGLSAARKMLQAPQGLFRKCDDFVNEDHHEIITEFGRAIAVWSTSRIQGTHRDDVFCVASHGGKTMAFYALRIQPKALICNDAGRGLDDSGIAGVALLDDACVPGATVGTESARIGDPLSTYYDGVISYENPHAHQCGVRVGMSCTEAVDVLLQNAPASHSIHADNQDAH
jgi:hypothetical protein